jgi:hypothetical protein
MPEGLGVYNVVLSNEEIFINSIKSYKYTLVKVQSDMMTVQGGQQ